MEFQTTTYLNSKLFLFQFQQMEEKVASLERLIDQKDSQLAQMKVFTGGYLLSY